MRALKVVVSAVLFTGALLLLGVAPSWAQDTGRITGNVDRENGRGMGGVTVVVSELGSVEITAADGSFRFNGIPAGSYTLSFSLGDNADSTKVEVTSGATTDVQQTVGWDVSFAETITVYSASRRRERIVDAPAAVTVLSEQQLARESTHGQLPKVLEFTPGAEVTQNGLYDFNFNTRGFNSSLNRRILVLIDGRDPSVTFLGSQEWTSLTVPLDALASVELVRGPGSALYGADAFNGVINMTTKAPRDSSGGRFKLTGGELETIRGDLGWAGSLGNDWHARVSAGALQSEDFARSRVDLNGNGVLDIPSEGEYAGVNLERQPLVRDENEAFWGSLRLDKYFESGPTLSLEAGTAEFKGGGVSVTGIGRVQATKSERPYFRFNLNTDHWNFSGYYNDREAPDSRSLSTGAPLYLFSDKTHYEAQGNVGFAGGKGRLIGGASYSEENFDSENPQGAQTLVFESIESDFTGVYGQVEYDLSKKLRTVLSARYDESSLYDSQFSPRIAFVYSVTPEHTLRLNYGEAFQSPNYSELFLQVPVAAPVTSFAGLQFLFCAPFGVDCQLSAIPVKALGNPETEVEEVETLEIGYSGILGKKTFVTLDYYRSTLTNFISDLLPAFDPAIGFLNPSFGRYQAPAGLPDGVAASLEATLLGFVPTLTNDPITGAPLINGVTYTNFGEVDTQGIELGINSNLSDHWLLNVTFNWFDFDTKDDVDPNAPETQFGVALTYLADKFDIAVKARHVDGFFWQAGVFAGPIPSYDLVDLQGTYHFNDRVELGVNISNVFDEKHYQIFGGDIIERRALAHLGFSW